MFIGRQEEIKELTALLGETGKAGMIYGKRKIGKTTLIREALKYSDKQNIYYECIKGSLQENIDGLTAELVHNGAVPEGVHFESFPDVFRFLNTLPGPFNIVIDEYPYLKSMTDGKTVDSTFQSIIDNRLTNCNLLLSGSHISIMRDLLKENNALYGRFQCILQLKDLSYLATAAFYPEKSAYDKIAHYAVFGGSPYVNLFLRQDRDLRENILQTILNVNSPVYLYASHLLMSDFTSTLQAERIFSVIGNGAKRYSEIESKLHIEKTGALNKQLAPLVEMEQVRRTLPINRINDDKKATYELSDNLLRFYYTYVYKQKSALEMLGAAAFYDAYVEPTITEFISRRFEEICRDYFSLLARAGRLPGVRNIGRYYYDDPKNKKNGEFDVVLEYADGYDVFEAKFLQKPMDLTMQHHEAGQIREIRDFAVRSIGFISANGFAETEDAYNYLDGTALYQQI